VLVLTELGDSQQRTEVGERVDADGRVETVEENLDECVLCELCIQAAPAGTVRVKKLYDGTELRSS
jgi:NAD-dependent dihydropyrimidine dehydrogenase PreA subunit